MNFKLAPRKFMFVFALFTAITLLAYWPVKNHEFINLDDDLYITGNQQVKSGVTAQGIRWAFSFNGKGYWQPLTWLSHMLDVELFGLNPAGHHLTNLGIHLASTILLFLFFYRATGHKYRSAFLAAAFALHPLNVDSVAWAAERKNLLSSFFWMLCLFFYVRYAQGPTLKRYGLVAVTYILGLMVKPMLVTLPFVLLLLDYWPLKRLRPPFLKAPTGDRVEGATTSDRTVNVRHLVIEKIPLLAFSALSIWLSIISTRQMGIIVAADTVPMTLRIANALVSYIHYLSKLFWPDNLAVFYPFPQTLPFWQVTAAGGLLVAVTVLCLAGSGRKPYLLTGWFWFLGTLVPVIGLIQAGEWPAMADRWAYIPMIGIILIISWVLPEMMSKWRHKGPALVLLGIFAIACCALLVRHQLQYWDNSRALFSHTLEITSKNGLAHNNYGSALLWDGENQAALYQFKKALEIRPHLPKIHNNIGHALMNLGRVDEAIDWYQKSLKLNSKEAETHSSLGVALMKQGHVAAAIKHLKTAVRLEPGFADAYVNLGAAYRKMGQTNLAARSYLHAIRLQPDSPEAYNNLGLLLLNQGKLGPAAVNFKKALELKPDFTSAHHNLEKVRAAQHAHKESLDRIQDKINQYPEDMKLYLELGDLYKEQGALKEALGQYQKALSLQPDSTEALKKTAILHAMRGEYAEAAVLLNKMILLQPENTAPYIYMAGIHARQNNLNESLAWINKAIARGYRNWDQLRMDSNFDNIRTKSDFKALIPASALIDSP